MGPLIFSYGVAAFFLVLSLVARRRLDRGALDIDEQRAADLRRSAENPWSGVIFGGWAFLAVVGGAFLLARGDALGWGWFASPPCSRSPS